MEGEHASYNYKPVAPHSVLIFNINDEVKFIEFHHKNETFRIPCDDFYNKIKEIFASEGGNVSKSD